MAAKKKLHLSPPSKKCPYQSYLGSYIKNIQDINESHIPTIFQFAIHHLLYQTGAYKAIIKEFLEHPLSESLEEEKVMNSPCTFNYLLGSKHCFTLERTISRIQFFIDHFGTNFSKTNRLDGHVSSILKENFKNLMLIKYEIEEIPDVPLNVSMIWKTPNRCTHVSLSPMQLIYISLHQKPVNPTSKHGRTIFIGL